jgi:ribosomal protein S25
MGRQTKLTASQHEEIRAAVTQREFLRKRIEADKLRIRRLSRKALAARYDVNIRTIDRVLSGDPYGSIKPECLSHS